MSNKNKNDDITFMLKIIQEDSLEDFIKYLKTIKTTPTILQGLCRDACLLGAKNIATHLVDTMKINPACKNNGGKKYSVIYMLKEKIYQIPTNDKSPIYYSIIMFLLNSSVYIPNGDEDDIDLDVHLKNNQHYIDMKKEYTNSTRRSIILEKL